MRDWTLKTSQGELTYRWNNWLEKEHGLGYLPKGYKTKVLELEVLRVKMPGQGYGTELMQAFLKTKQAMAAELIFLDAIPLDSHVKIKRLKKFYRAFGFRCNTNSVRMWLVRMGKISTKSLPL